MPQLRQTMADSGLRFLDNGGVRLCLERHGSGPRHLLFAHGWISSRRMWYDVAAALDPAVVTMHLLDFRGCGLSDRPRAHGFDDYASDLRAAIAGVGEPLTLVGHSMGGRLAQVVAAAAPPNLQRLILVAPGAARPIRVPAKRKELAMAAYGSRERIERFQRAAMSKEVAPEAMLRIVDDALQCQFEHWMVPFEDGRTDFSASLVDIEVPTLAIAGESDPLAPPTRVKNDVTAAIAGSLLVVLRGCGHNLPVEAPGEIAAAAMRFQ